MKEVVEVLKSGSQIYNLGSATNSIFRTDDGRVVARDAMRIAITHGVIEPAGMDLFDEYATAWKAVA